MYHHGPNGFLDRGPGTDRPDTLRDMVETLITRTTQDLSITPAAIRLAGFADADVTTYYADALARAQASLLWPSERFVALEGL